MFIIQFFLLFSCTAASAFSQTPTYSILQPNGDLIDQKVHISMEHLPPLQEVEIEAFAQDVKGEVWSARARFKADAEGMVDLSEQEPLKGSSYEGVDSMGLFWSMLPVSGNVNDVFKCKEDRFVVDLKFHVDGNLMGEKRVERYCKAPEVARIAVNENGLVGALFLPPSEEPLPVVIVLSGSNGGLSENRAKLLASHGCAAFALGYFGVEGLPSRLKEIPLEYFEKAFAWIKGHSALDGERIGLYGVSRGGELVLLLSSLFPESIQAVAAVVPSSVVHGGLSETPVDAWVYRGKPVMSFLPTPPVDFSQGIGKSADNPAMIRSKFIEGMQNKEAVANAAIPVEKISCPLLLVSAGDDQMWPSDIYVEQIQERLVTFRSTAPCRSLYYPEAGHGINIPHLPIPSSVYCHPAANLWFSMGGSRSADARASAESWREIVAFFDENLKRR